VDRTEPEDARRSIEEWVSHVLGVTQELLGRRPFLEMPEGVDASQKGSGSIEPTGQLGS
jgi:hypothetical protein